MLYFSLSVVFEFWPLEADVRLCHNGAVEGQKASVPR